MCIHNYEISHLTENPKVIAVKYIHKQLTEPFLIVFVAKKICHECGNTGINWKLNWKNKIRTYIATHLSVKRSNTTRFVVIAKTTFVIVCNAHSYIFGLKARSINYWVIEGRRVIANLSFNSNAIYRIIYIIFRVSKKKKKFHVWWNSWRVNEEALAGFTLLFRRIQTLTSSPMLVFLLVSIIVLTCFAILLQHFTHFATWLFHFYYFLFVLFVSA